MIENGLVPLLRVAAAVLLLFPAAASAKSDKSKSDRPWSLGVTAGLEYDSNITVDEADLTTRVGDTAGIFELEAGYNLIDTGVSSLDVEYEFSQSLHVDLDNFDIQSHAFSALGSTKVDGVTLGGRYSFYHTRLAGDDFLDMHMVAPRVAWFLVPNLYVQGSYYFFDKDFAAAFDSRDVINHQPGLTAFYFFDKSKAYVSLAASYEAEDAAAPQFDYDGYGMKAALQLPFSLAQREGKLKFDYAYLERFYSNITPSIGVKRRENRSTYRARAEIPIVWDLSFSAEYRYVDRDSNLPSTNYNENNVEGSLSYRF